MTNPLDRRLRKLEGPSEPKPWARAHLVLMPRGASIEVECAKVVDFVPGDELLIVRFVRPGDDLSASIR